MCPMVSTNRYGHVWPWGFSFPEKAAVKQHQFSLWLPVGVSKLSANPEDFSAYGDSGANPA